MANYKNLSQDITNQLSLKQKANLLSPYAFDQKNAIRRNDNPHDYSTLVRNAFIRDVDKILNCPYYNRYSDKTQVFSLCKNDDIARRGLHVQLVSRIARTIGNALGLNLDLIEAIALGHDLGHTPFGHTGEYILDDIYREKTGRRFFHNIQSVRVLDKIFPLNVTLQTLDGVACHNGEMELERYMPTGEINFKAFDRYIEDCYQNGQTVKKLVPSTLEGCVVRVSDIIAYLGKDRYDAVNSKISLAPFADYGIGTTNAEIIHNLTVSIIENSFDKPYIKLDKDSFNALKNCKADNYDAIYKNSSVKNFEDNVRQMMDKLYLKLLSDLSNGVTNSPIFTHHIEYLTKPYYKRTFDYMQTEKNQIVVDYIASMTDDYFGELFSHLFPNSSLVLQYKGYFEKEKNR